MDILYIEEYATWHAYVRSHSRAKYMLASILMVTNVLFCRIY